MDIDQLEYVLLNSPKKDQLIAWLEQL